MKTEGTFRAAAAALWMMFGAVGASPSGRAEDWPVYHHDNGRSAVSGEHLAAARLGAAWTYRSTRPPEPAWDGAAKWDAYAGIRGLKSMREYDPVPHVVVAGQRLFFGSTTDDSVHCLDARTGRELWVFTTDGPVRIAPTWWQDRVFFGSDDGHAYCVDARSGALVWKHRPSPEARRVLYNGRMIPLWPCRTGVLVDGGTAYFAAGLLPWKESYLCAVDALTGAVEGPGRFSRRLESVTLEGALLASTTRLISPQGRVPPLLFERRDGAPLGSLEGGGGCFVVLTPDDRILHGPGNKTGWVQESSATDRSKIATFNGANALVVQGDRAFILTDHAVAAMDRKSRREVWRRPMNEPLVLILAGDTLYTGGADEIAAFRAADGEPVWWTKTEGSVHGLAVADGALFASSDLGLITCYRPGTSASATTGRPALADTPPSEDGAKAAGPAPARFAAGPSLRFTAPDRAEVWWQTEQPSPTLLRWRGPEADPGVFEEPTPKTEHRATLTGLKHQRLYHYAIQVREGGVTRTSPDFECDNFFNYSSPPLPVRPSPYPADERTGAYERTAEEILRAAGLGPDTQGICLVLASDEGRLAYELARRSALRIIGVDTDATRVARARQALLRAGVYGSRVALHRVEAFDALPFVEMFADLLVVDGGLGRESPIPAVGVGTWAAYLRPRGGMALLGGPAGSASSTERISGWVEAARKVPTLEADRAGAWAKVIRGAVPGSGDWTHQYGGAQNSGYNGEKLQGASRTEDLDVQWLGRPGPRAQPDRNGRKPAPLSTQGRLFVQGLNRIIALNAYNGSILWSREIPPLQRFNIPRDSSNWCADDDHLYAAIEDRCWRLDGASGELTKMYPVQPGARRDWDYEWSYLAVDGRTVVGSAVRRGTAYLEYWGKSDEGWYDAVTGPATFKVCSETLFALDQPTGERRWTYTHGRIINSTIAIADGRVYFIESRHPKVLASESHRIGLPELWQNLHLVALDLDSGRVEWDRTISPERGEVMFSLAQGGGRLVLVSSGDKAYHVYSYRDASGEPLWNVEFPWPKDNHGGHMARPAIVGERVFVRPHVLELATGKRLEAVMPAGGCGTYAATEKALFFRNSNVTVWDPERGYTSAWERLRPDCWLSTIPAAGLLLSPEAGGGCSCGSWMETSIVFVPVPKR